MFSKKVIQVVALIMAVLMLLGVFGAAISAFAAEGNSLSFAIPATGQLSSKIPFIIGGVALVAAIICLALSKKSKTKEEDDLEGDYIKEDEVEAGLNFFQSKKDDTYIEKPEEEISDINE